MNNPYSPRANRSCRPCLTWRPIIDAICDKYHLSRRDVLAGWKSPKAVMVRHEIFWTLNKVHGAAMAEIGRRLGGYHHTTVMHGVRKWQARLDG